ncbi:MAG: hypothetical protein R2911_09300 [Caldilineaceae bacterium]
MAFGSRFVNAYAEQVKLLALVGEPGSVEGRHGGHYRRQSARVDF